MSRVFILSQSANPAGRLVVVFAHKHPDAWETLVSAIIRAGFVVDGSWPIQTEWLTAADLTVPPPWPPPSGSCVSVLRRLSRAGTQVLEDMRENIRGQLREFWDAGIRGPDFVWAATGPAMEAYSKHPVVKKANEPGPMTVSEFLTHVRRIVVDFVVGRVLSGDQDGDADTAAADRLDEPTAYYLLHRHDFGLDEAPAGACSVCRLLRHLDRELAQTWDLIGFSKGKGKDDEGEEADADAEADAEEDDSEAGQAAHMGAAQGKSMGYEAPGGKPIPLIDRAHRLMHLWKTGICRKWMITSTATACGGRSLQAAASIPDRAFAAWERGAVADGVHQQPPRRARGDAGCGSAAVCGAAGRMRNEEQEKHDDPRELHRLGVRHLRIAGTSAPDNVRAVNSVLTATYWEIGRRIVEFEQGGKETSEYGEKLLERISGTLTARHGRGFSRTNVSQMRAFYAGWEIVQTPSEQFEAVEMSVVVWRIFGGNCPDGVWTFQDMAGVARRIVDRRVPSLLVPLCPSDVSGEASRPRLL